MLSMFFLRLLDGKACCPTQAIGCQRAVAMEIILTRVYTHGNESNATQAPKRVNEKKLDLKVKTIGVHHIGLTVSQLEASAAFFIGLLGWKEVRRDPTYPAIFVSDGEILLTLWSTKADNPTAFDKNTQVGLHHLALQVDSLAHLHEIHALLKSNQVPIEFAPEPLRDGPIQHMMCYEPSGIRLEFIFIPE